MRTIILFIYLVENKIILRQSNHQSLWLMQPMHILFFFYPFFQPIKGLVLGKSEPVNSTQEHWNEFIKSNPCISNLELVPTIFQEIVPWLLLGILWKLNSFWWGGLYGSMRKREHFHKSNWCFSLFSSNLDSKGGIWIWAWNRFCYGVNLQETWNYWGDGNTGIYCATDIWSSTHLKWATWSVDKIS